MSAVRRHLGERLEDLDKSLEEGLGEAEKERIKMQMEKLKQEVTESTSWDDLGFDEFDRVEVLLEVETEFGDMVIPDEEADKISGVKETLEYMKNKA